MNEDYGFIQRFIGEFTAYVEQQEEVASEALRQNNEQHAT